MPQVALSDLAAALGLLTRLPVPVDPDRATARGARAAWAYPLAGLAVAASAGLAGWLALAAGWSAPVAAALVLGAQMIVTGAMHEDGLADCVDGFWGGWDPDHRMKIMKDSAIGAYGVLALLVTVLLRWTAVTALIGGGSLWAPLLISAAVSRAGMVWMMRALPHAREGGLSHRVGRPPRGAVWIATALAVAVVLVCDIGALPTVVMAVLAAVLAVMAVARWKIGGQTGDVLGATQQAGEVAVLLVLLGAA